MTIILWNFRCHFRQTHLNKTAEYHNLAHFCHHGWDDVSNYNIGIYVHSMDNIDIRLIQNIYIYTYYCIYIYICMYVCIYIYRYVINNISYVSFIYRDSIQNTYNICMLYTIYIYITYIRYIICVYMNEYELNKHQCPGTCQDYWC